MKEDEVILEGTKRQIADRLLGRDEKMEKSEGTKAFRKLISQAIDFLGEHQENFLMFDEDFQMNTLPEYDSRQGLIAADAEYYICVKKPIYILAVAVSKRIASVHGGSAFIVALDIFQQLMPKEDMAFFKNLDKSLGESCVVLEAAKNRKKGIDESYFLKFKSECINNDLGCRLCHNGYCKCDKKRLKEICEELCQEKVFRKTGKKYFYIDFI